MASRNTILTFGFAALGALAAVIFISDRPPDDFTVLLVLGFAVPALSTMILALWLSEFVRMARAGAHVAKLEQQLNRLVTGEEGGPLTWEHTRWPKNGGARRSPIASGSRAFVDAYVPVLAAFTALVLIMPTLAVRVTGTSFTGYWWACIPWFIMPTTWLLWRFEHYYRKVADQTA
jgi:hypothetical protein